MDERICVFCKHPLVQDAPPAATSGGENGTQVPSIPDNLRGHRCCRTGFGHLAHFICVSRHLRQSTPRSPAGSSELKEGDAKPYGIPSRSSSSNGSGDATSALANTATRRTASLSLGDNNSSEPKQPRMSNVNEPSASTSGTSNSGSPSPNPPTPPPPPPPPLSGVFAIFSDLPPAQVQRLSELRNELNEHLHLMDDLDTTIPALVPRLRALAQNRDGLLRAAVEFPHWLLTEDAGFTRGVLLMTLEYLEEFRDWLNGQNWMDPDPTTPPQQPIFPVKLRLTADELLRLLWGIGPVCMWRLNRFLNAVNKGGCLDSFIETLEEVTTHFCQIIRNEENVRLLIPRFAEWLLNRDIDVLLWDDSIFVSVMLRWMLEWLVERGL